MDISAISNSIVASQTSQAAPTEETNEDLLATDIPADQMGSRLAILAKKEKAIREQQGSFAQKMKELEEREAKLAKYKGFDDVNDENAVDFLKNKGLSLEKLQEKWLSTLEDSDLDPIQKQIKELQGKLSSKDEEMKKLLDETLSKRDQDKKSQEIEEQSKFYNEKLKEFLTENSEKYDLISTFQTSDEVFKIIKDVYLKTSESGQPKLLKFDEAADMYEAELAKLVEGMRKSKKVMSLLGHSEEEIIANPFGQQTIDSSFNQSSARTPDHKNQAEREKAAAKLFESMISRPS